MTAGLGCREWGWPLSAQQSRGKLEQSLQLLAESVVAKGGVVGWMSVQCSSNVEHANKLNVHGFL